MDMHSDTSLDVPAGAEDPALVDTSFAVETTNQTGALVARYVLVEDLDYLWRTGTPRAVLTLRWTR